ncbi:DUF4172 domain-containing protein [Aeromonas veronii]
MEPLWIWQQADWPHFRWQDSEILPRLRIPAKLNSHSGQREHPDP